MRIAVQAPFFENSEPGYFSRCLLYNLDFFGFETKAISTHPPHPTSMRNGSEIEYFLHDRIVSEAKQVPHVLDWCDVQIIVGPVSQSSRLARDDRPSVLIYTDIPDPISLGLVNRCSAKMYMHGVQLDLEYWLETYEADSKPKLQEMAERGDFVFVYPNWTQPFDFHAVSRLLAAHERVVIYAPALVVNVRQLADQLSRLDHEGKIIDVINHPLSHREMTWLMTHYNCKNPPAYSLLARYLKDHPDNPIPESMGDFFTEWLSGFMGLSAGPYIWPNSSRWVQVAGAQY